MGTYIARRLLLMIPTLIGITFLVFMLVALSPGGIGASLRAAGGQMEATSAALREAYLEDRYGLNDPVIVQYFRWLGRISPVKFGERAQVAPTGERIHIPKPVGEPLLWRWVSDRLPDTPAATRHEWSPEAAADPELRSRAYRRAANNYAQQRASYVAAGAMYEQAIANYLRAVDRGDAVTGAGKVRDQAVRSHQPERERPEWAVVEARGQTVLEAYARATAARADLVGVFQARPFPQAGIGVIPGYVSIAAPDFGVSFARSRPVLSLIGDALPITLMLNLIAFPIIYLIAIPSGLLAATRQGTLIDIGSGALFIAMWSFPIVLAGVLAVGYLANNEYLGAFPVSGLHHREADTFTFLPSTNAAGQWQRGYVLDALWHICLPVACLVYGGFAVLSKQTRAAMLDNFNADYVRTAKAKGVAGRDIVLRHVFRNSLLPLITMFVGLFPAMLSGSVVIERIFSVPGMGSLALDAISLRDRELILATTLMIGAVNLLALLLADILYALADPRVSYE